MLVKGKRKDGDKMRLLVLSLFLVMRGTLCAQSTDQELVYKSRPSGLKAGPAPVLIVLHGYGSNEEDLFDLANTIDARYAIYSLRGPLPLNNGGFAWYHLSYDQNNRLTYDYQEVIQSRVKVMRFIRQQCLSHQLDSNTIVLMGFSQGAMLAYDLALSNPGKIVGVMALSGRLMEESKVRIKPTKVQSTSFFIAHGIYDALIPITEAEKARDYLRSINVTDIVYTSYPMQHVLNGQEIIDIRAWLSKLLEPKAPVAPKKGKVDPTKK
jgi:phospholipase/carboxylesterase